MSTRTPLTTVAQPRARAPVMSKGSKVNENNVDKSVPSYLKPTMSSSTKTAAAKQSLTPKTSRPALAALAKPHANATPKPKSTMSSKDAKPQPLGVKTPSTFRQPAPMMKTPGPAQKVAPRSTKKTISVYTPAREPAQEEVEYSHPRPAPLRDGPSSPVRRVLDGEADCFSTSGMANDLDDLDLDPPAPPADHSSCSVDSP